MCRLDVWLAKWDRRVTRKLIKFDLFRFKLFPQAVQKHQLGEVRIKITPSSCIFSGIFLPKVIKIEQCLTKLWLMKDGHVLFWLTVYITEILNSAMYCNSVYQKREIMSSFKGEAELNTLYRLCLLAILILLCHPLTSSWPHLNSDVGLEEGEY